MIQFLHDIPNLPHNQVLPVYRCATFGGCNKEAVHDIGDKRVDQVQPQIICIRRRHQSLWFRNRIKSSTLGLQHRE